MALSSYMYKSAINSLMKLGHLGALLLSVSYILRRTLAFFHPFGSHSNLFDYPWTVFALCERLLYFKTDHRTAYLDWHNDEICWVFLAESNLINFYHKGKQLHIKVTTSTWNWCGNWDFIVRWQTQCEIKTWTRRDSDRTCFLELWESLYFYNLFYLLVFLVLSFFWHPVCLEQFGTSAYVMV